MTLQQLRLQRDLSQKDAAKILSIRNGYLCMIESGDRKPSDELKEKMARLYRCSIEDIFLGIKSTKRLREDRKNANTNKISI